MSALSKMLFWDPFRQEGNLAVGLWLNMDICKDEYLLGKGEFVAMTQLVFQVEGRSTAFQSSSL